MGLRDIKTKCAYESAVDDVVELFYDPALAAAVSYDRIAGFFSSSSLAIAARGMGSFIANGGRMRLICSPVLSKTDADILAKSGESSIIHLDIDNIEDEFVSNHVKALGWLLQEGRLEIRLAVLTNEDGEFYSTEDALKNGLFHQKVGVLTDANGDAVSFSGSVNETASAWTRNDEEFKVFRSWKEEDFFQTDRDRFDAMWERRRRNVRLFAVPDAVREKLISFSRDFDKESISVSRYRKQKAMDFTFKRARISLFPYQATALDKWKANGCCLLFEMATGSGKTRTALAGLDWLLSSNEKMVAVIACPQDTLAKQWRDNEVGPLGIAVDRQLVADSTNSKWEEQLRDMLLDCALGIIRHGIVYTTHKTLSGDRFRNCMEQEGRRVPITLIADEAHWLGAPTLRLGLLDQYRYRIGLSATPSRWFDDEGTAILVNYFGNTSFEFTIKDALTEFNPITEKHFLVNYFYNIRKVGLNHSEGKRYKDITAKLVKLRFMKQKDPSAAVSYNRYLEQRADIIRDAEGKYAVLEQIIEELKSKGEMNNLIVFVSENQIDTVSLLLSRHNVTAMRLTDKQGTFPRKEFGGLSEREHIIKQFKMGRYQALIAIKCLDEGIDIPDARRGILMASSTNPREYVQRIGRIIRQAPDKTFANLYDICVEGALDFSTEEADMEKTLREKEIIRLREIADNAINQSDALHVILSLKYRK